MYRMNYVCVLMWREYEDREWATCEYMEGWDGLCVVGVENLELKLNVTGGGRLAASGRLLVAYSLYPVLSRLALSPKSSLSPPISLSRNPIVVNQHLE